MFERPLKQRTTVRPPANVIVEKCFFCTYDGGDNVTEYCEHHRKNPDSLIEATKPSYEPPAIITQREATAEDVASVVGSAPAPENVEPTPVADLPVERADKHNVRRKR